MKDFRFYFLRQPQLVIKAFYAIRISHFPTKKTDSSTDVAIVVGISTEQIWVVFYFC